MPNYLALFAIAACFSLMLNGKLVENIHADRYEVNCDGSATFFESQYFPPTEWETAHYEYRKAYNDSVADVRRSVRAEILRKDPGAIILMDWGGQGILFPPMGHMKTIQVVTLKRWHRIVPGGECNE